jgi:hypothetical protein
MIKIEILSIFNGDIIKIHFTAMKCSDFTAYQMLVLKYLLCYLVLLYHTRDVSFSNLNSTNACSSWCSSIFSGMFWITDKPRSIYFTPVPIHLRTLCNTPYEAGLVKSMNRKETSVIQIFQPSNLTTSSEYSLCQSNLSS